MEKNKTPRKRQPTIHCDYSVRLYEDGKYHWMYDLNMLKNPSVLIEVYWVLGVTVAIFAIIMLAIQTCSDGLDPQGFGFVLEITGITAAILLVLGLLGYLVYAAVAGWTYSVHFIMDEKGVEHRQAPRSAKVAKRIGALTTLSGLAAGKPGVMGAGMIAANRTSMSSDFSVVKKVKAVRWMDTIQVNEPFGRNRVYVNKDDFDFVYTFILSHCPKAQNH